MDSFWFLHFVLFLLLPPTFVASSPQISYNVLESHKGITRSLLQQQQSCPVNLEYENYTIITSQCKGPAYPRDLCCNSFLQIACPLSEYVNDMKSNCALTLFSYINHFGRYPPGLFSSMCHGDKLGLSCDKVDTSSHTNSHSRAESTSVHSSLLMITIGVIVFLLNSL